MGESSLTTKGRVVLWAAHPLYAESTAEAYRRLFGTELHEEPSIGSVDNQGDFIVRRTRHAVVVQSFDANDAICALTEAEAGPDGHRIHVLKTWPAPYQAVMLGTKTFELRRMDRRFRVGDLLHLVEWDPAEGYTQRGVYVRVTYLLEGPGAVGGLAPGFCIMGLGAVLHG